MGGFGSFASPSLFAGGAGLDGGFVEDGGLPQPTADAKRTTLAKPIIRLNRLKPRGIRILQPGATVDEESGPVVSLSFFEDLG